MRWIVCLTMATMLGGCASGKSVPLGQQPVIQGGTTVIALAIVPATGQGTGCRAKLSRDPALVRKNRPVLWEIVDVCNDTEQTVEVRFTTGELKQHLTPKRKSGKVRKGMPDYLEWFVGKEAHSGQYADYEIWLNNVMLADPRIQVP